MEEQEEMQKIVEAAGECWHNADITFDPNNVGFATHWQCSTCKVYVDRSCDHPSPTDLNELFRLAEKLYGRDCRIEFSMHYGDVQAIQLCKENKVVSQGQADTKADALRTALVKATEGK